MPAVTFANFFATLRARWLVLAIVVLFTTLTAFFVSLTLPKKYTAQASVVVDAKPDPISALNYAALGSQAMMNTQVEVFGSPRVALRAVQDLKLADNPQVRSQWLEATNGKGSIEQWLASVLQKDLEIKPSRESNVINITYQAADPTFAAAVTNGFVKAFIATTIDLRVDPARRYSTFFDNRAKEARETLELAQEKLSKFQNVNGIVVNDERVDVEMARLNELSSQLVGIQGQTADSSSRQSQVSASATDRLQEVLNNPVVAGLKSDLNRSEARLQELSARYGDSYPLVIETKASIAEMRARLDAETRRIGGGVTVANNVNRQREGDVRGALEAQRSKVLRLKAMRDEGAVLQRDVESAQRAYEGVTTRLTQSSLESQSTQSTVNVLTEASVPTGASFPRIPLNTALALVVGIVLGTGIVMLLELLDRRVRSIDDVVVALQLPLLGVLPKPGAGRSSTGSRRLPGMEQRLLGSSRRAV